jgi:sporulation protein YlmC with PRC-barrel domain
MRRLIWFHLLDRQIVDRDGLLVGKVDDVELATGEDGRPVVEAVLLGPQALGDRLGGRLGRLVADVARRLHPEAGPEPTRIPWGLVERIGTEIKLSVARAELPEPAMESWLREHVVEKMPGALHASE